MKLIWLTDIHLNFLAKEKRERFYQNITKANGDAVLISGDIAEAADVGDILQEMGNAIKQPIYFVLGNHDFYYGLIADVRNKMEQLTKSNDLLYWLPAAGIQSLDNEVVLVGQDGWADGRLGDFHNSRVGLNDARLIPDLFQHSALGKNQLLEKMQQLAEEDAIKLKSDLQLAIGKNPKKIIVLIHVPPFKESCLYRNKISNDDYLPYFSSKITGDVLLQIAQENLSIKFLVFCGHTHGKGIYSPIDNLIVNTGKAEYSSPEIQKIIDTADL